MQTIRTALATLPRVGRTLALGSAVLMALTLVACGGKDDTDLPSFDGAADGPSSSESSAAGSGGTPAVDPASKLPAEGTKLGDAKNAITVGRTVTGDPAKEAVQTAYLAFWAERAKSLRLAEADAAAVRAVSSGVAADRIFSSVNELKKGKNHTEGGSTVNIQTVTVKGSTARVTDCFLDTSINMDADGKPVEQPNLGINQLAADLEKSGATWRVSNLEETKIKSCKK
jgi:hypothetical protein